MDQRLLWSGFLLNVNGLTVSLSNKRLGSKRLDPTALIFSHHFNRIVIILPCIVFNNKTIKVNKERPSGALTHNTLSISNLERPKPSN
jgi:hypothetical protein